MGQLLVTVSSDGDVQMARWSLLKRSLAPTIFPEEMAGALVHVLHPTAGSGRNSDLSRFGGMGSGGKGGRGELVWKERREGGLDYMTPKRGLSFRRRS